MPSFDIVSRTDLQEVDNAVNGAMREISQRYDFKGSDCGIERAEASLTIRADDEFKLKQVQELLRTHLARRKVDAAGLLRRAEVEGAGGSFEVFDKATSKKETVTPTRHTHDFKTDVSGGGYAHENLPPYFALCFIMKL